MPFNEANPIPISYNAMSDAQLRDFSKNPNEFLSALDNHYVRPSLINPATKARIETILKEDTQDPQLIKKRLDTMALIKITKIVIEW